MFNFQFFIRAIACLYLMLSFTHVSFSQKLPVKVLDERSQPLMGATLIGPDFTTQTDETGKFILENPVLPLRLSISYVGFETVDTTVSDDSKLLIITLKEQTFLLKEGLVTASWASENSAVTQKTISKNAIYTNNITDMPLLLESLPGAVSTSDAGNGVGYSAMRIRGSDQTRINVMIDGVPVNDAESQNVFWVDLPDLIEDVQSIQVQRGVGVSTAGPGAFGANINLRTGQLNEKPGVSANIGYGSFNSKKVGLSLNSGKVAENFRFKVRGSHVTSDGYIDRASSELWAASFQSQYSKNKFSLAANVYWGKQSTYQAWNGSPIQFYLNDPKTTYNPSGLKGDGSFFDDETDNYMQLYSRVIANYRFNNNSALQLTFYNTFGKGYYNQYREENINEYFEDLNEQEVNLVRERWLDNNLTGLNFLFNNVKNGWNNQIGGNLQNYDGKHFGIIKTIEQIPEWNPRNYYSNDAAKREASLFVKSEKQLGKFNVFADLQGRMLDYSYEGLISENEIGQANNSFFFFNPKAGFTYFLNEKYSSNLYLFGGIANKEPNRDDFTDAAPGKLPTHETMYNSEIGYRYYNSKFSFSVNQYYMFYKNQLVLTGKINDVGAYTRFNVDRSYRLGVEADFNYKISDHITISGNAALSQNKIIDFKEYIDASELVGEDVAYLDQEVLSHGKTDIAFSPSAVIFGSLKYAPFVASNHKLNKLTLAYTFKYVSSQYLDNSSNKFSKLDAYAMHGLTFQLPVLLKKNEFMINVQLDNLLDKNFVNNGWSYRYKAVGYDGAGGDPYVQNEGNNYYSSVGYFPQAGRRFFVGLKYNLR